jgi:hypothetical protein
MLNWTTSLVGRVEREIEFDDEKIVTNSLVRGHAGAEAKRNEVATLRSKPDGHQAMASE